MKLSALTVKSRFLLNRGDLENITFNIAVIIVLEKDNLHLIMVLKKVMKKAMEGIKELL